MSSHGALANSHPAARPRVSGSCLGRFVMMLAAVVATTVLAAAIASAKHDLLTVFLGGSGGIDRVVKLLVVAHPA